MVKQTSPIRRAGRKSTGKQNEKNKPRSKMGSNKQIKIQKALYEIADGASAVTDIHAFYKRLHEIVGTLMYAENFFIALHDPQTDLITWPYYVDTVDIEQPEPITLKEQHGGTGWILRTGRTLSHAEGTVSYAIEHGEAEQTGTVSDAIGVPLKSEGKIVGVLLIQSYRDEIKYNLKHVEIMNFVAQHISIALTRARAIEETRKRNSELAIINSLQAALAAQLDIHSIYEAVGKMLREIFNYQDVTIYALDPMSRILTVEFSYELGERSERRSVLMNSLYEYFLMSNKTFVFNGNLPLLTTKFSDYQNPEPPKSLLAVPVRRNKDTESVVYLTIQDWSGEKFFSDSDVQLMETLANSMSVALENARLFDETQRLLKETEDRAAELAIINSVQTALASKLDFQGIIDAVGNKVCEIFPGQGVNIGLVDRGRNMIRFPFSFEKGRRYPYSEFPIGRGLSSIVIDSCKPLVLNSNTARRSAELGAVYPTEQVDSQSGLGDPKSWMGIPINIGEIPLGVIVLEDWEREESFTDPIVRMVQTLASSMGVALENARLFDETQRLLKETEDRAAELAVINSVQEGLASKLEMQAIYDLVGDKIMEIFKTDVVGIGFYNPASKALDHPYVVDHGERFFPPPMPIPNEMVDYLRTHDATLINTYQEAQALMERFGIHNIGGPTPDNSYIVVPLTISGEFMGRITVAKLPAYAFNQSDVRLLQTLVNSMSVALENARLWEQEKLYRKALQRELEIGREIQNGFLPETLPQVDGWEIAALLMSAREVAGDFYDAFELPDGTIGLVIADVCDKGVGAALFMTLFRSLIRAASNLEYFEHTESVNKSNSAKERIKRAISLTNNYIAETHGDSGMFATLFFGILDPRDGRLVYINGGHEPPLVLHVDGQEETLLKTGPAVGAITGGHFDLFETILCAGDIFLAFTDGVPDCKDPHGDFYGRERLLDIFRKSKESAQELVKVIESDLRQYIANTTQFDDITLLAMQRK